MPYIDFFSSEIMVKRVLQELEQKLGRKLTHDERQIATFSARKGIHKGKNLEEYGDEYLEAIQI